MADSLLYRLGMHLFREGKGHLVLEIGFGVQDVC